MPDATLSIQLPSTPTRVEGTLPVERGLLLSLSAFVYLGSCEPGSVYVRAGISSGTMPPYTLHTTLLQGWVHDTSSPTWTGTLLLEPGDRVHAIINSEADVLIRIMGRTIMQPFPVVTLEP